MKTNKYADLVKFGLSPKTLMTLSESDVNRLHSNLVEGKKKSHKKTETKEQTPPGVTKTKVSYDKFVLNPGSEMAVGDMIAKNVGGKTEITTKSTGFGKLDIEEKKSNKKNNYPGVNPWAVCHAQ